MAQLAARTYGNPESNLVITGVTGTNGKTSVTHILQSLFSNFGYRVGVIGTVGSYIAGEYIPGVRTTPESTDLYALLAKMVESNVTHVFMEVSSHALEMERVAGLKFAQTVFTNLSQDHLDFHGTMENYFAAKAKLFTKEVSKHAVINSDDSWGKKLISLIQIPTSTVGMESDWSISDLRLSVTKTEFNLTHGQTAMPCTLPMIGQFNAINAAMAVAVAVELGLDEQLVTRDLINVHPVPGRSQIVTHNSAGTVIVDYAHTPEAVEKVLETLREVCDGQLITVLGCGGDRDSVKRPLMGKIAAQISDVVIVTDDNPRSEDPAKIRSAILAGIESGETQVLEVGDRRNAIQTALSKASHSDVIAVLGKGHEQGQEIAGVIYPFDDVQVIQQESANV
jgi:UDP-N-acetylmuramoyl-L-alanyl-D-glutamate--2,6-diaminopimelate ligase